MKTRPIIGLITILTATLLPMATLPVLRADEVSADISSYNPHEPEVILRQIELNVALKQYEKVITEEYEMHYLVDSRPQEGEKTKEEVEEWRMKQNRKRDTLQEMAESLRERITKCINDARKEEAVIRNERANANLKEEPVSSAPKTSQTEILQGKWKGVEVGREAEGNCTMDITRDSIHFQGADKSEWYKATYTIVAGDPAQIHATITDCPAPDFVGKSSSAIYKIEGGKLTLAGNKPGDSEAPKRFEGNPDSRVFVFKRTP